jgi:hypothetical protein
MTDGNTGAGTPGEEEEYGHTERQIAFKLLAAHAMVDAEFYARLREDPAAAADELHIALREDDLEYLRGVVEWPVLDKYAEEIRTALHTDAVVRSIW